MSNFHVGLTPRRSPGFSQGGESFLFVGSILVAWCGFLFFYRAVRAAISNGGLACDHWPGFARRPLACADALWRAVPDEAARGIRRHRHRKLAVRPRDRSRQPACRRRIAATLTVLFAFTTLRRSHGANRAFVAAMLLPMSLLWLDKAPSAEIDMLQLAWVASAFFCFLRAVETRTKRAGEPPRPTHLVGGIASCVWPAGF